MKNRWLMNTLIKNRLGAAFLAAGFIFMAAGAYRREIETVFTKAAAICLECIGIG